MNETTWDGVLKNEEKIRKEHAGITDKHGNRRGSFTTGQSVHKQMAWFWCEIGVKLYFVGIINSALNCHIQCDGGDQTTC